MACLVIGLVTGLVTGRVPAVVALPAIAALLAVAGCGAGAGGVCSAIGYASTLVVQLDDGWPDEPGRSVRVDCSGPCPDPFATGEPDDERTVQLTGTSATVVWADGMDDVVVTVLGADGAPLASVDAGLDWVRVGGSAECGGPLQATVTVPAP